MRKGLLTIWKLCWSNIFAVSMQYSICLIVHLFWNLDYPWMDCCKCLKQASGDTFGLPFLPSQSTFVFRWRTDADLIKDLNTMMFFCKNLQFLWSFFAITSVILTKVSFSKLKYTVTKVPSFLCLHYFQMLLLFDSMHGGICSFPLFSTACRFSVCLTEKKVTCPKFTKRERHPSEGSGSTTNTHTGFCSSSVTHIRSTTHVQRSSVFAKRGLYWFWLASVESTFEAKRILWRFADWVLE